jgi:hypothetical protein
MVTGGKSAQSLPLHCAAETNSDGVFHLLDDLFPSTIIHKESSLGNNGLLRDEINAQLCYAATISKLICTYDELARKPVHATPLVSLT